MSEKIFTHIDGKLVEKAGARDPAKTYSDIGADPDGTRRLLEWGDAEVAARAAESAAWTPRPDNGGSIADLKARIAALEAKSK